MVIKNDLFIPRRAVIAALPLAAVSWTAQGQDFRTITAGQDVRPRTRAEFDARYAKQDPHDFVGMWMTADRNVRYKLMANGRYDSARGTREGAYRGRYVVSGNYIDYVDDSGLIADGEFKGGILHQYGMVLYRDGRKPG
jgi:hypothetical protein